MGKKKELKRRAQEEFDSWCREALEYAATDGLDQELMRKFMANIIGAQRAGLQLSDEVTVFAVAVSQLILNGAGREGPVHLVMSTVFHIGDEDTPKPTLH